MKKTSLIIALSLASTLASKAAFISFATGGARGHQFVLNDGTTRVAFGSNVKVGYLGTPGDTSTFIEFGTTTINNPLSTQPIGGFINTKTGDNANVAGIRNQQVVLWVYGQNGQQGAFTSPAWTVPASLAPDIDASFDVTLGVTTLPTVAVTALAITNFTGSGYTAPVNITVGTGSNVNGAAYRLGIPVPEPTGALLASLVGFGLVLRRRR